MDKSLEIITYTLSERNQKKSRKISKIKKIRENQKNYEKRHENITYGFTPRFFLIISVVVVLYCLPELALKLVTSEKSI